MGIRSLIQGQNFSGASPQVLLQNLTLDNSTVTEGVSQGSYIGYLQGELAGSTYALVNSGGGKVELSASNDSIVAGIAGIDFENNTTFDIVIEETNPLAANSPLLSTITISVINVLEVTLTPVTLSTLNVNEDLAAGTQFSSVSGVNPGASLSLVNSSSNKVALVGNNLVVGSADIEYDTNPTFNITLRQTHPDAVNSPLDTTFTLNVTQTAVGGISLGASEVNMIWGKTPSSPIQIPISGHTAPLTFSGLPAGINLNPTLVSGNIQIAEKPL